ncbi:MAG: dockerin type I domain-containing protein, partial [Myxococcota bacterium]|nr:dockerin type I domain-containing protein [Myxococcota bacterium]
MITRRIETCVLCTLVALMTACSGGDVASAPGGDISVDAGDAQPDFGASDIETEPGDTTTTTKDTDEPVGDVVAPIEDTTVPVEDTISPVEDTPAPLEDTHPPVEDTPVPVEDTTGPAQDAVTVADAETQTDTGGEPPCSMLCGDSDQDGDVDADDVTALESYLSGEVMPSMCPYQVSDLVADGALTLADLHALQDILLGTAYGFCQPCTTMCGDADGDFDVDADDILAIENLVASGPAYEMCLRWAADVDGDGVLTSGDASTLEGVLAGTLIL